MQDNAVLHLVLKPLCLVILVLCLWLVANGMSTINDSMYFAVHEKTGELPYDFLVKSAMDGFLLGME